MDQSLPSPTSTQRIPAQVHRHSEGQRLLVGALVRPGSDLPGQDWVWAQCRERKIPHHKLGRSYRFTDGDLKALAAQSAAPLQTIL